MAALLGEPEDCCALPRRRDTAAEPSSAMLLPAQALRLTSRHHQCGEHLQGGHPPKSSQHIRSHGRPGVV